MKNYSKSDKCRQAAIAYIVIGIAYTIAGTVGMPPHDYGALIQGLVERKYPELALTLGADFPYAGVLWATLITLGLLFFGLSYFIYKGTPAVLYTLCVIYLLRTVYAGKAVYQNVTGDAIHSASLYIMFPLVVFTFYMLIRATFNLKP